MKHGNYITRMNRKVKLLSEIIKIASKAKKEGKKIVTTNGCFDLFHIGHAKSLEKAKSYGDLLIVGVNSDKSVRDNKGMGRPIIPAKERVGIIASLAAVDYVFLFNSKTASPWIEKIKPHFHIKGADRKINEIVEREAIEKNGGKIILTPYIKSTTDIIKKIQEL